MSDPKPAHLVCVTNPLDPFADRQCVPVQAGVRLSEAIHAYFPALRGVEVVATVNGALIELPMESDIVIHEGDMVTAIARITGGGSSGSKDVIRTVAMIGVIAAAMFVPGAIGLVAGTWGYALATAAISVGGALLINALLPAQKPTMGGLEPSAENTYGWAPSQNLFNEGLAIPILFGKMRVTPMIISRYVTTNGETQTLSALYCLGEGLIKSITDGDLLTNVEINENSAANYTGLTLTMKTGTNTQTTIAGFQRTASEKAIGTTLTGNAYTTNVTAGNAVESIALGFVLPSGLAKIDGNQFSNHSVVVEIQYKLTSEPTTWTTAGTETITGNKLGTIRSAFEYAVTAGEYDVRCRVTSVRQTTVDYVETIAWEYLQEFVNDPFTYPNTAVMGMKALATDQLNGVNPRVTVEIEKETVAVWNGASYENKPANNPAWACYDLLHNARYGAGIPYARLIYADFLAWANFCSTNSYALNIYLDYATSMREALTRCSTVGRGAVAQRGTNFGCVFDGVSSVVQLFTTGNIIADSFTESYLEKANRADVIEITILDAANNYERRTIEISRSDYDTSTSEIKVTQVALDGCTDWEQAAKYGKFLMNCQEYLMRTITFKADVDAIACQPGDVISVQHDVPQWGFGGRVAAATANTVTLDQGVVVDPAVTYVITVRHSATDVLETKTLANPGAGTKTVFTLASGNWATTPAKGDLYAWGQQNIETKDFRVLSIKRSSEQICEISALEYRAEVYIDGVTIPEYPMESDLPQVAGVRADDIYPVGPDGERRAPYIDITWRGFAVLWNVFVKENDEGIWRKVASVNRTGHKYYDVDMGKTYTVSVSVTDNPEDGVQDTIKMEIDPPEAVVALTAEVLDNFVMLKWKAPFAELPISHYEVLRGATFAQAVGIGRADKTFTTVMEQLAGNYTYWVYAVDTAGNAGPEASVSVTLNLPTDYEQTAQFASAFDGTLSDMVLQPDGIFGPVSTSETWTEHFEDNGMTSFQDFIDAGYTYYYEPDATLSGYYIEGSFDTGATITASGVYLKPEWFAFAGDPSSVVLTPTISVSLDNVSWTDYVGVWTVQAKNFRYIKYRVDVAADLGTEILVTNLTVSLVLRHIEEAGAGAISVANTGLVVTFSTPFVDVSSIVVTPLYDAGGGRYAVYDFTDIPNPVSFTVYLYDAATGDKTTGSFSYLVKGV